MTTYENHCEFDNYEKLANTLEEIVINIKKWNEAEGEHLESMLNLSADLMTCAVMFKEQLYARHMYLMLIAQNMQTRWNKT